MVDSPVVVGINRTQDASICVAEGPARLTSLQKERITRRKHHWGRLGDLRDVYAPNLPALARPVDLVVQCYSSDSEWEHRAAYDDELRRVLALRDGAPVVHMSHHLAHLYSAFFPSPFDAAAVMVIDAQGSRARDFVETFPGSDSVDPELLEISSFYACDRAGRLECLGKQLWDGDWNRPVGLGCFYYLLTRTIFPHGEGNEGKVMGLAPFGRAGSLGLPRLVVREHEVFIPDEWMKLFEERDRFRYDDGTGEGGGRFEDSAHLAAEGQRAFEDALLQVTAWLRERTGATDLCFAGGTALNCSANGRLQREAGFHDVFIPPSPHDGGTALGCAVYGLVECLGVPLEFRWTNDFLGPQPDEAAIDRAAGRAAAEGLVVSQPDDMVDEMIALLSAGKVVSLYQGRSESGPRALGNRSIIADPRRPEIQDFINAHVKGREWFRPLAPLVLADHAERIFAVDRPAPFMQYAADVRPEHRAALPAITHVDGTARLQTVEPVNTPFLHELLARFEAATGSPVLLNTSLNGKGDPLVETPADAVACLRTTAMHALAMPPYLIVKAEEGEKGS